MHCVDIFSAVNTQGFVSKFLCAMYTFSFITLSYTPRSALHSYFICWCVFQDHTIVSVQQCKYWRGKGDGGTPWSVPENATESDLLFLSSVSLSCPP